MWSYLLHIHDVLIKSRALVSRVKKFELSLSSCCHYLLNSKSNREGENFLFVPLLLAECFLTVLGETNSQEISLNTAVNRPRK